MTGIEPALSAWEADVLPLNYIGIQGSETLADSVGVRASSQFGGLSRRASDRESDGNMMFRLRTTSFGRHGVVEVAADGCAGLLPPVMSSAASLWNLLPRTV